MRTFDHFVAIDWSGAKGERQKGIALACCTPGRDAPTLVRPDRRWSRADVLAWLTDELPPNSLVGIDLSPGLPFDGGGGYFPGWPDSPPDAKSLWKLIDEICADDPHLASSSFVAHPDARRHFRHGKGDCGDLFQSGVGRLRETERRQKNSPMGLSPSSCFNLVGAAQVGKSSLTGMRVLHRLAGVVPIWPFDDVPAEGSVIVEIYTSLAARAANLPKGRSKMLTGAALDQALRELDVDPHTALSRYSDHATDAILTAAWLRVTASDASLWHPSGLATVARTEGWTFGVP
ncbi:MAG: hypothetical protein V4659_11335 [Pseudomonadota bacterium]